MEDFNRKEQADKFRDEDVISIPLRAGKRTYFFDLKKTKSNNHYLVITESHKKFDDSQIKSTFQKQKIFIYKNSILTFAKAFNSIVEYMKENIDLEDEHFEENGVANQPIIMSDEDFLKEINFDESENI